MITLQVLCLVIALLLSAGAATRFLASSKVDLFAAAFFFYLVFVALGSNLIK